MFVKLISVSEKDPRRQGPDSTVHEDNIGPTWVPSAPGGPYVGLINFATREAYTAKLKNDKPMSVQPSAHYPQLFYRSGFLLGFHSFRFSCGNVVTF